LRGTDFEDFIAEVFEGLGFSVRATKATGDQGVDLIVRGRGRLIAVQAKGCEGGVGNKAVQEVYAGMDFYRCRECIAITNSYFTASRKSALSVDSATRRIRHARD
jgi:restriction system protein